MTDSYNKLQKEESEDVLDYVNMKYGRGAYQLFKTHLEKSAENEYETGRIDGLLEAVRILRD